MTKKIAIFIDNDFYFIFLFLKFFFKKQNNTKFIIFIGKDFINIKRIFITFFSVTLLEFCKIIISVLKNKNKKNLEKLIKKNNIKFYYSKNLNSKNIQFILKQNKIKNIFSIINSKIFKKKYFKKYNIYNLHLGKIPNYKGIVPVINALLKKEKVFYSSVFMISFKGIDTGKLIFESYIYKKNSTNVFNLYEKLYEKGFNDMRLLSEKIFSNKKINFIKVIKKNDGNYYKYPNFLDILKISKYFNQF